MSWGGARGSAACTSLLLWALLPGRDAAAQPFTEVASAVGLTMRQHTLPIVDSNLTIYRETYFYSGGVAIGDYDADGDPDVFLTGFGTRDALYQNQGGAFVDVAAQVGLDSMGRSNGAYFVDVDRDGDLDLVVTTVADGAHRLYINRPDSEGDPTFVDEAVARGVALSDGTPLSGFGVAEGDYDRDGYPDLFVTEWLWEYDHCVRQHSRLLRNRGAEAPGFFEDVTRDAGVWMLDRVNRYPAAFAAAFSDLDDDGLLDLVVVSDFRTSRLFWNRGDGTFEDGTEAAGVGTADSDMGSSLGDYDGDGDLDWFVSAIYHPNEPGTGNRLFRYDGGRAFTDVASAEGVLDGGWGWGAAFADFDSDGDLDLVMASDATDGSRYFRRHATGFERTDAQAGLGVRSPGRGLALLDYDGDGDEDFLLTNNGGYPFLYRNDAPAAPYLRVRPIHADGTPVVGADVRVSGGGRTQRRQIGTNTHFLAQSEPVAHFGVGPDAATVDVSVRFPSGALVQRTSVTTGQTLTVVEPPTTLPTPLPVPPSVDCDADGEADECSPDCDGNGRADSCDLIASPEADCDGSGVLDACELSLGLVDDCDANGRPDACDLATGDCNHDGMLDACTAAVTTCHVGAGVTQPTPTEPPRSQGGCSVDRGEPVGARGPSSAGALMALLLVRRRRKPRP